MEGSEGRLCGEEGGHIVAGKVLGVSGLVAEFEEVGAHVVGGEDGIGQDGDEDLSILGHSTFADAGIEYEHGAYADGESLQSADGGLRLQHHVEGPHAGLASGAGGEESADGGILGGDGGGGLLLLGLVGEEVLEHALLHVGPDGWLGINLVQNVVGYGRDGSLGDGNHG